MKNYIVPEINRAINKAVEFAPVVDMLEEEQLKLTNTWTENYNLAVVDNNEAAIAQIKSNIENGSIIGFYVRKCGSVYFFNGKEKAMKAFEELVDGGFSKFLAVVLSGGTYISFTSDVTDEKGYRAGAVLSLNGYYAEGSFCKQGVVDWAATVGANTTLHFGVHVGKARIEKECFLWNDVEIEDDVYVGRNTDIGPAVKLYKGVTVGKCSYIHDGLSVFNNATIGEYCRVFVNVPKNAILPFFMSDFEFVKDDTFFIRLKHLNNDELHLPVVLHEGVHYIALNMSGYMPVSEFLQSVTYNSNYYEEIITQLPDIMTAIGALPR